jgi:hypothetical protein
MEQPMEPAAAVYTLNIRKRIKAVVAYLALSHSSPSSYATAATVHRWIARKAGVSRYNNTTYFSQCLAEYNIFLKKHSNNLIYKGLSLGKKPTTNKRKANLLRRKRHG